MVMWYWWATRMSTALAREVWVNKKEDRTAGRHVSDLPTMEGGEIIHRPRRSTSRV